MAGKSYLQIPKIGETIAEVAQGFGAPDDPEKAITDILDSEFGVAAIYGNLAKNGIHPEPHMLEGARRHAQVVFMLSEEIGVN